MHIYDNNTWNERLDDKKNNWLMLFFVRWYFTDISERLKQDDDNDDDDDNNEEAADAVDDDAGWRSENKGEWISRWVTTESCARASQSPPNPPSRSTKATKDSIDHSNWCILIDRPECSLYKSNKQSTNQPLFTQDWCWCDNSCQKKQSITQIQSQP